MNTKTTTFPQTIEIPSPLEIHPSVSPLAAELMMKTAEVLAATPQLYLQHTAGAGSCNTPCCIFGWMRRFSGEENTYWKDCITSVGLTPQQAESIFKYWEWPACVAPRNKLLITAHEGIARIEHFLRTGE